MFFCSAPPVSSSFLPSRLLPTFLLSSSLYVHSIFLLSFPSSLYVIPASSALIYFPHPCSFVVFLPVFAKFLPSLIPPSLPFLCPYLRRPFLASLFLPFRSRVSFFLLYFSSVPFSRLPCVLTCRSPSFLSFLHLSLISTVLLDCLPCTLPLPLPSSLSSLRLNL